MSQFTDVIMTLRARRGDLASQMSKLDAAIAALQELDDSPGTIEQESPFVVHEKLVAMARTIEAKPVRPKPAATPLPLPSPIAVQEKITVTERPPEAKPITNITPPSNPSAADAIRWVLNQFHRDGRHFVIADVDAAAAKLSPKVHRGHANQLLAKALEERQFSRHKEGKKWIFTPVGVGPRDYEAKPRSRSDTLPINPGRIQSAEHGKPIDLDEVLAAHDSPEQENRYEHDDD